MLSEYPIANHRFDMTDEKNDYTISDCVSQRSGTTIVETMTCLTCHAKTNPKIFNDISFIIPFKEI